VQPLTAVATLQIIIKPPPAAEAICFRVVRPCRCPCVRPSVRDSRGSFMFPRYLQYLLTDFRQTFVTGASRDRDELIRFWGQKVKVQGHGMTECIPDFHVSTISPVSIDRFSPNVCHWCILRHRLPDYVFGSKGQRSRSHAPSRRRRTALDATVECNFFYSLTFF